MEYHLDLRLKSGGKEGKYWLALSNKSDRHEEPRYWVNYGDNKTFGWFTADQIIKWLSEPSTELHTLGGTKERD